jgi:hypothetical protein
VIKSSSPLRMSVISPAIATPACGRPSFELARFGQGRRKKQRHAMRPNAPEWQPGRRGAVETLLSDFVPPFPASGRRNVRTLPRKASSRQTGFWDGARSERSSIPLTV